MTNDLRNDIVEDLISWGRIVKDVMKRETAGYDEYCRIFGILQVARESIDYRKDNAAQLSLPLEVA